MEECRPRGEHNFHLVAEPSVTDCGMRHQCHSCSNTVLFARVERSAGGRDRQPVCACCSSPCFATGVKGTDHVGVHSQLDTTEERKVMVRDLDISPPQNSDGRRLEVVAEGLTSFGGCQFALNATLVSPLHGDGTHRRGADIIGGTALGEARKDKVRIYPELCRGNGRALLVVIVGEVGGPVVG